MFSDWDQIVFHPHRAPRSAWALRVLSASISGSFLALRSPGDKDTARPHNFPNNVPVAEMRKGPLIILVHVHLLFFSFSLRGGYRPELPDGCCGESEEEPEPD